MVPYCVILLLAVIIGYKNKYKILYHIETTNCQHSAEENLCWKYLTMG
jgi:hypothetical protein